MKNEKFVMHEDNWLNQYLNRVGFVDTGKSETCKECKAGVRHGNKSFCITCKK